MTVQALTTDWSDAIVLADASMLQAQGGRVAIFTAASDPGVDPGTILASGATVLFGPGTIRARAIGSDPSQLHYQPWA